MRHTRKHPATHLQVPRGTETLLLDEAYVHQQMVRAISDLFASWGYLPIETPVLDFFDVYGPLFDDAAMRRIYRLVDRDGEVLMLRSDSTLFMAKQMAVALQATQLPVRVCYFDTILRHHDGEEVSRNEFYQVGAELIGREGKAGDLEILALLNRLLDELQMAAVKVHIGSQALLTACFPDADQATRRRLAAIVLARDWDALATVLDAATAARAATLFSYIGPVGEAAAELQRLQRGWPQPAAAALQALVDCAGVIDQLAPSDRIRIDLSEIGSQPYYTGLVFGAYADGIGSALAAGGRYDELMGMFGTGAPAAGFSLLLRKAEPTMGARERFLPPRAARTVTGKDFVAAYREAEALRAAGQVALL